MISGVKMIQGITGEGEDMEVRIDTRMDRAGALQILITTHRGDNLCILQHDGTYQEIPRNEYRDVSPTLELPWRESESILQGLLDAIINKGYRPTVPIVRESEMNAVKYHLEDMRKLVFEKEE